MTGTNPHIILQSVASAPLVRGRRALYCGQGPVPALTWRHRSPAPGRLAHPLIDEPFTLTLGQAYKALAVFFGILAAVAGFFFVRMNWSRGADFDVTGFLWLAENAGRLMLLALFVICVGTAISYWIRGWRAGG